MGQSPQAGLPAPLLNFPAAQVAHAVLATPGAAVPARQESQEDAPAAPAVLPAAQALHEPEPREDE